MQLLTANEELHDGVKNACSPKKTACRLSTPPVQPNNRVTRDSSASDKS